MNKQYFIVSDAHGFYDEMMDALHREGFDPENPDHVFVSIGDLFDRGLQAKEMLEFVNGLKKEQKILILGNHELLMEEAIRNGFTWRDIHNGTFSTAIQLTGDFSEEEIRNQMKAHKEWNRYISDCRYYAEVDNHIFVHGWIPNVREGLHGQILGKSKRSNWRNASKKEWYSATWVNGMEAWANGYGVVGKTVWCGHWHTSYGHCHLHRSCSGEFTPDAIFTPFIDEGICAMDACTAYSHVVNCLRIQVDELKEDQPSRE